MAPRHMYNFELRVVGFAEEITFPIVFEPPFSGKTIAVLATVCVIFVVL